MHGQPNLDGNRQARITLSLTLPSQGGGDRFFWKSPYDEHRDRTIINALKDDNNIVRSHIVPLITNPSEEGAQLRANIGLLHHRLENYHLDSGKGDAKQRITLTNVYLRDRTASAQQTTASRMTYSASEDSEMETAKIIRSGGSQVVLLPDGFHIDAEELSIRRHGNTVILEPVPKDWFWLDAIVGPLDEDFVAAVEER